MPLTACTIVSKNYLPFGRVLARSFARHCPKGRFVVLLVDRIDDRFDPAGEPFEIVGVDELVGIPELDSFLFKYSILEANTAVKPYFLEHLLDQGESPVIYFDPDILITGSLDRLAEILATESFVVTPHLTTPIDDAAHPSEQNILQSGSYNLGFLGLRDTPDVRRMLRWWQDRLYDQCVVRIEDGLFVDQKWIDLLPGLHEGVHILRDPGYNVAYWNLHGRVIETGPNGPTANGRPLAFFHFSGIEPESLDHVSVHQNRFRLSDLGDGAALYRDYAEQLFAAGFRECKGWPYVFGRFDNGVKIPGEVRRLFLDLPRRRRKEFGNPFATEHAGSFWRWLNEPVRGAARRPFVSRYLRHLYDLRGDLARKFPDPEGGDLARFRAWVSDHGRFELGIDDEFLTCFGPDGGAAPNPSLLGRAHRGLRLAYRSDLATEARSKIRGWLGPERTKAVQQRLGFVKPRSPSKPGPAIRFPVPSRIERPGVNLIGYLQAEIGMGQAARALLEAFRRADIPVWPRSLDLNVLAPNREPLGEPTQGDEFPYDINLWIVNADQLPAVYEHFGPRPFVGRFNIGYWLWELATFPATFHGAFDYLHEIWTPSRFCGDAIARASPWPVRRVPLPVDPPPASHDRAHFDLGEEDWVVLYMFNYLSYFERKNPLAAIEAFRRAFDGDDRATLVLKTSQEDFAPEAAQRIREAAEGARVRLVDRYLTTAETSSLVACCDTYLSLHRSEGFGLTLAEAMAHGKPVVATAYSGNCDFFDVNNGFPVGYRLLEIEDDEGPYPAGAVWADPDTGHAARLLRQARENAPERERKVQRAREDVASLLGPDAVAEELRERFDSTITAIAHRMASLP